MSNTKHFIHSRLKYCPTSLSLPHSVDPTPSNTPGLRWPQSTLSLLCTICSLLCTICSLLRTICSLLCTICSLLRTICSLLCTICSLLRTICSLLCTICSILCTICLRKKGCGEEKKMYFGATVLGCFSTPWPVSTHPRLRPGVLRTLLDSLR